MEKPPQTQPQKETITQTPKAADAHAPLELDARDLLGARQEATILHAGERYRLRITANNKLILTK